MKITIKNFQSIEDLTLNIVEGAFTCIVGQSNIGKSAIRRAIECVLYNNSDASYIRNGTKQCSVEITFDNGTNIKWMRDEKSASYDINGERFSKLSKTIPQPIIDMGFKELEVNKEKLNVQVASQFDNIFLLNMTGSKVTDVFSNLGNLNKIINANKSCTSDLKNNKGRLSLRKEDLISIKSKIKKYSGLDEQRNSFDSVKVGFEEIKKIKKKKEDLSYLSKKFDKSAHLLKALSPSRQINIEEPEVDVTKFIQLQKLLIKLNVLN
jgi:DNA repair ATPase RecN